MYRFFVLANQLTYDEVHQKLKDNHIEIEKEYEDSYMFLVSGDSEDRDTIDNWDIVDGTENEGYMKI